MMANMSNGGLTPMRNAKQLQEIGYAAAIYPALTSVVAAAAVEDALIKMVEQNGSPEPEGVPIFEFKEFCSLIGFDEVWDFEKKWADK
jgi:2-methylisocitrate lyase-like PEP mutase family enzyme